MASHLIILRNPYLDAVLRGKKTVESRFGKNKGAAFRQVRAGDVLFLKLSSGPVCGTAKVTKVEHFEDLTAQKMAELKRMYNEQIMAMEDYWQSDERCRYGAVIWLANVRRIEPVWINKRDWRAWVVLSEKEDFGLLKGCKKE